MLSEPIVAMMEEELERLRQIRAILLPLLELSALPKLRDAVPAGQLTPVNPVPAPPTILRLPPRVPRRHGPRIPKLVERPVALRGAIPNYPVVIRPSVSKPIEAKRESPLASVEQGNFAALVRAAERDLRP